MKWLKLGNIQTIASIWHGNMLGHYLFREASRARGKLLASSKRYVQGKILEHTFKLGNITRIFLDFFSWGIFSLVTR